MGFALTTILQCNCSVLIGGTCYHGNIYHPGESEVGWLLILLNLAVVSIVHSRANMTSLLNMLHSFRNDECRKVKITTSQVVYWSVVFGLWDE